MDDFVFRKARPEDAELAIPLIESSGPTSFAYVFDNQRFKATDFLTYAFQSVGGEFSFDNHIVMTINEEVIGIGAVFSGKRAKSFTLSDGLKIIRFYGWSAIAILIRGLKVERIIKLPGKNEVCLGHIAISPAHRSKGFGQKLMEHLMLTSEKTDGSSFVLDVSEENPRAKSLYDRMGFITTSHNLSSFRNQYGYVAHHFRMEKK